MTIRTATAGDLGAIVRLLDQAQLPTADLVEPFRVDFWVAERNGTVVGAVGLEGHGEVALLRSLVVDPAERGGGIGVALVTAAEAAARARGIESIVLLTQTARDFFLRRGYSVIPREAAPAAATASAEFQSLCPASAVCMIKAARRAIEVLFLCTGNSCRSILAEATFNHLAPKGWHAMSAGSKPTGKVHPRSLSLLQREGISTDGYYSKSWHHVPDIPNIVITVCSSAAGETCPAYLGPALRTHWGVADPAHATGTDAEIDAEFMKAYRTLRNRIEAFLALPLDELKGDRSQLKSQIDRIGATTA